MTTTILSSNPQTSIKAMRSGAFMCIAPTGHSKNLEFNKTMVAVAPASASVSKLAKFAKQNGISDKTHTIYQVCPSGTIYEYSIDKN